MRDRTNIVIDRVVKRRAIRFAENNGVSLSEYVERLIDAHLQPDKDEIIREMKRDKRSWASMQNDPRIREALGFE